MSRRNHWHTAIKDASEIQAAADWVAAEVQRLVGEQRLEIPPVHRPGFLKLLRDGPNSPIVAAFTQFEAALREFWAGLHSSTTSPPVGDLVNAISSRHKIPAGIRDGVHRVRRHRNDAVHNAVVGDAVAPRDARRSLGLFLARLPDWE